jgi:hypothetical protein
MNIAAAKKAVKIWILDRGCDDPDYTVTLLSYSALIPYP